MAAQGLLPAQPYLSYDFQPAYPYMKVFKAKKQASPLEYGCEYRSVLEKQAHEHEESLRRELVSRGRGHPAKDIYIPGIRHKTEIKLMQAKRRPTRPVGKSELMISLQEQVKQKKDEERRKREEEKQNYKAAFYPFLRLTRDEIPLFQSKARAPPPLSKQEYAAALKTLVAIKQGQTMKQDELMHPLPVTGAGDSATYFTRPYPTGQRFQARPQDHNIYKSVITHGAPPTPQRPTRPRNPYTPGNYHRVIFSAESVLEKVKALIKSRGDKSFGALRRSFKHMDVEARGLLTPEDFRAGLMELGLRLSGSELDMLMQCFDLNGDGNISLNEFLEVIRGGLNPRRRALVDQTFNILDINAEGVITVDDIAMAYNVDLNPKVAAGLKSKEEALMEFLMAFDASADGQVTKKDFVDYYKDLSALIEEDDMFELVMRNSWRIPEKQEWAENSDNLRVLVVHHDNTEEVITIQHDLGLNPRSPAQIRDHLMKQGVQNIKRISLGDAY